MPNLFKGRNMIIVDIPTWLVYIGWFLSQVFKIVVTMFLLVWSLNKIDSYRAEKS